jgi:hypothetical protein
MSFATANIASRLETEMHFIFGKTMMFSFGGEDGKPESG